MLAFISDKGLHTILASKGVIWILGQPRWTDAAGINWKRWYVDADKSSPCPGPGRTSRQNLTSVPCQQTYGVSAMDQSTHGACRTAWTSREYSTVIQPSCWGNQPGLWAPWNEEIDWRTKNSVGTVNKCLWSVWRQDNCCYEWGGSNFISFVNVVARPYFPCKIMRSYS